MYAPGTASKDGILSRSGPALAVIGIHILIIYGLAATMGVVKVPQFAAPIEAVFIPEQTESEPEPPVPVKPEIDQVVPTEQPMPEIQFDEPVAPPTETPMPASENAIAATAATGAVAQDLKTSNRVEPTYPSSSRRAGEEGTVRLKVLVDEKGRPRDVAVATSSGFARLDQAAMEAVRKWRFVAATDGTNPISAWTHVAITFRLTTG
ncbi:energy transducer TonB [Steroidobacter sp. S1-65]|uniref:Protein TonB n=1 Tax=Steroidobacter gossypii TaxID=2805490 RepID=A0ABS1X2G4_9GAMM|nr:energy transducer TonB [Steroidobacter gossypii]MBM0107417.1 energy transducer TonB [Steroidobacter gossypii]